jgi:hypothetical protein
MFGVSFGDLVGLFFGNSGGFTDGEPMYAKKRRSSVWRNKQEEQFRIFMIRPTRMACSTGRHPARDRHTSQRVLEIANGIEAVQDCRMYIDRQIALLRSGPP